MRILHVLWSGAVGGMQRSLLELVRLQHEQEWGEIGVLFAERGGPFFERYEEIGCRVELAPRGGGVFGIPATARGMRRYDLHHFHSPEPVLFAASLAARGARRVFTERGGVHGDEELTPKKRLRHAVAAPMLRRGFHAYSGNTAHAARVVAARYRLSEEAVSVTYNAVDFERLDRAVPSDRTQLGVPGDAFLVATAAYLKPWKRVDILLEACAELPETHVLVVGDGPDRQRLEALAMTLGMRERVTFTGLTADVAEHVAAADAFGLLSTALESFGNAAVEAMALRVPTVVMRDSLGLCEHVEDGRTGFVTDTPADVRAVLERLAGDAGLRSRVGAAAAADVRERYTRERMGAAYRALYARATAS